MTSRVAVRTGVDRSVDGYNFCKALNDFVNEHSTAQVFWRMKNVGVGDKDAEELDKSIQMCGSEALKDLEEAEGLFAKLKPHFL